MSMNNTKFFLDGTYFKGFDTSGANNNVITIGDFEYAPTSDGSNLNPVYCSFRGNFYPQITSDRLDEGGLENSFAYVNTPNGKGQIKIVVSKSEVADIGTAIKYITGMLVSYELAPVVAAGTNKEPLYEVETYLSDGTLVSPSIACSLPDIARKIQALETNFNLNEVGYYKHVIHVALAKK